MNQPTPTTDAVTRLRNAIAHLKPNLTNVCQACIRDEQRRALAVNAAIVAVLESSIDWFEKAEAEWSAAAWERHPELGQALTDLLQQELALADAINEGVTP